MAENLKTRLKKVKQVLDQTTEEPIMAEKKTAAVRAVPTPTAPPPAEKNKTEAKPKKEKEPKPADDPNLVKLADLVKEAGTTGQAARRKLRSKEFARSGRWAWTIGSAELKAVRELLGLPA